MQLILKVSLTKKNDQRQGKHGIPRVHIANRKNGSAGKDQGRFATVWKRSWNRENGRV